MSQDELRLTCEDFEKDNSPEVLLERFNNGVLSYAMYASSSRKDGHYDTTSSPTDLDNDGDFDDEDKAFFLTMANAFAMTCQKTRN
ncbi:hypothetical protein ICJ33_00265 [Pseudomonas simiae]|jgi:hypothetical protein|uniref:Uncharacterized protein n=1 Tax=Pseudomonas simiae TaxID=321846 RepID=A0A1N7U4Y0_9PSED|nr:MULTISPECIES: hypothetical protein [Pseudomonas]AIB34021.1 hypothetical protein PS417_00275 [Pseudomonas simiae]QQD27890.1 hypothetical protein ICJ33_00265 [Pseudomonas simiae]SFB23387.1 hypothetical protein SAMN05216248_103657 [Pseudomonas simiae]